MTITRREFVQGAAAGASLAALGASLCPTSADDKEDKAAAQRPSANDTLVVGVMGVNGRGNSLARSFAARKDVAVAYVCDVDERAVRKTVQSLDEQGGKKPQGIKDFRKILEDEAVDALVIAAPDHWHAPATILACTAGKHVYVEKPACHNPREGELMVAAARKNKRVVQLGTQRRSRPKMIEAVEALRAGAIGRVYYVRSWYANQRESIGRGKRAPVPSYLDFDLWQGPAPRKEFRDNLVHYHWHWFWHWGTGELGNNGVHGLDICRWGLGVDYPIRITSAGGRYHFQDDQETPDTHTVSFDFDGGKTIFWEGLSCNRHGIGVPGAKGQVQDKDFGITFHGDEGTLAISDLINGYILYDKADKVAKTVSGPGGDAEHIEDFIACIRSGGRSRADIEEGVKSTLLCHLGNIAHRVGRSLTLDPKTHQIVGDDEAAGLWGREYEKGWEPKA
jgi:predicted dehydrogenase